MDFRHTDFTKNNNPNMLLIGKFENKLHDTYINTDSENQIYRDL